jgi:hypothetical protein
MSVQSIEIKIIGADKNSTVVFSSAGTTPLPASAGVAVTVSKSVAGQVTGVHGSVSGTTVVFDSPA